VQCAASEDPRVPAYGIRLYVVMIMALTRHLQISLGDHLFGICILFGISNTWRSRQRSAGPLIYSQLTFTTRLTMTVNAAAELAAK